jgi:hypothetical protein
MQFLQPAKNQLKEGTKNKNKKEQPTGSGIGVQKGDHGHLVLHF